MPCCFPGSCGPPPLLRSRSYAELATTRGSPLGGHMNSQRLLQQHFGGRCNQDMSEVLPATISCTPMSEDIGGGFEVLLADQLRRLQDALTAQHKQELASVHEQLSRSRDDQEIQHSLPKRKQMSCVEHAPSGQRIPSVKFNESVLELACAPSSLAAVGMLPSRGSSDSRPLATRQPSFTEKRKRVYSDVSLGLHSVFTANSCQDIDGSEDYGLVSKSTAWLLGTPGMIRAGDEMKDEGGAMNCLQPLVAHPLTTRRVVHDLFTMLLIWYELSVIPMELSTLVVHNTVLEVIFACVWTMDVFLNFFRGFEEYGVVELRIWKTAVAYLKSWFVLDISLVLLDWVIIALTTQAAFGGVIRSAKTLRLWRAFQLLKFLRFHRIPKLFSLTIHVFRSDVSRTIFLISTWIAGILMLNHVTACFWYLLGSSPGLGHSWVQTAKENYMQTSDSEEPPTSAYLYLSALHWSVTQYTPASMEVVPRNSWERAYNIVTIFSSLVLFPPFLSSITNSVAALRRSNAEYRDAQRNLNRFLQDNRISLNLSSRIQAVISIQYENMRKSKRAHEPDVSLLNLLPRSLKEQMHFEVYQPIISNHPFLRSLAQSHERAVIRICDVAMCQESLQPGQELFAYGKEAEKVHFIVSGCLYYFEGSAPSPDGWEEVNSGDCLCDQVLWMTWLHRGQMTAVQPCELANLDGVSFRKVVSQRPAVRSLCCRFAEQYLARFQDAIHDGLCNDLGCSMVMLEEIAMSAGTTSFQHGPMTPPPLKRCGQ